MNSKTNHPATWNIEAARALYRTDTWSEGYFDIDARGRVVARPLAGAPDIDLSEVVAAAQRAGLRLPVLVRFTDILGDRIRRLYEAFECACERYGYGGGYTAVYPVKVNQQRTVVQHLSADHGHAAGLEAGSKPELMAVLALAPTDRMIVCNGYKDRAFLRLALVGQQLGHRVYIVVEKPSELALICTLAREADLRPTLGLRVRLASAAAGHWQNTGGEKSKFGLTAAQVLEAVELLAEWGLTDCLRMLHVHVGSQVADDAALTRAMRETAQLYRRLRELGLPVDCVDVGGGLAVDYEGRRATSFCSMNYTMGEYARLVVSALAEACDAYRLPQPHIVSESGRALTAHHAVLLTEVIDSEAPRVQTALAGEPVTAPAETLARVDDALAEARHRFLTGTIDLEARVAAERRAAAGYRAVASARPACDADRDAVKAAREHLAVKYFVNFSVFQSVPDVWALDQVFPVLPLSRHWEAPTQRARLCDLTCDSDGRMDRYVDDEGLDSTLPLHPLEPGQPYHLGIFMVGAYQENLGDMHNLFGDTDVVNVEASPDGWRLAEAEQGDRADELLHYVHFEPDALRAAYRQKLAASGLDRETRLTCQTLLEAGLSGYTYLV